MPEIIVEAVGTQWFVTVAGRIEDLAMRTATPTFPFAASVLRRQRRDGLDGRNIGHGGFHFILLLLGLLIVAAIIGVRVSLWWSVRFPLLDVISIVLGCAMTAF